MSSKVSVIIPCWNEERNIARTLSEVLSSCLPDLEVLVVDGMSTDGSREIVNGFINQGVKLIDNPARNKPVALNLGIKEAEGDIIIRIDAHASYPSNYIPKLLETIKQYDADNVGGIRETDLGETALHKAIAISISSKFGAGDALYRVGVKEPRYVETVYCGCYRKEVFSKIGNFNERLIRAQDREFNLRLLDAGGKILLNPDIRCSYIPRRSLVKHLIWTFEGAYWLFTSQALTSTKMIKPRNYLPMIAVLSGLSLLVLLLMGVISPVLAVLLTSPYLGCLVFSSASEAQKTRSGLMTFLTLLFVYPLTHSAYGFGSLLGYINYLWLRK